MICYSVQPRDRIFVKGYWFLVFAKNMGKNIGKNISKNLSGKYRHKLLDHAKWSGTNSLKTYKKKAFQKTADTTSDLIGNKIVFGNTKVSKTLQQGNSETVTNEHIKEITKGRYISPEDVIEIIDDLR